MTTVTVVLGNIWRAFLNSFLSRELMETCRGMTHDESVYSEPFAFKPERFFDKNGELNDDDRILAYGFGPRYLPSFATAKFILTAMQSLCWKARFYCTRLWSSEFLGVELTPSEQLWLTFASILATFSLGKAKDKSGKEIEINDEFEDFEMIR